MRLDIGKITFKMEYYTMKKIVLTLAFMLAIAGINAKTNNSPRTIWNSPETTQFNSGQVQSAYYVSGKRLVRIKIKIQNGQVTHYSTSKDYVGNDVWNFTTPASIVKTSSAIDGDLAREFEYTASISVVTGSYGQKTSLKIYF